MKYLRFIAIMLHGILFTANIMFAIIIYGAFPPAPGENAGLAFGVWTSTATIVSAAITIGLYEDHYDIQPKMIGVGFQTAIITGITTAWCYWLYQLGVFSI